MIREPRTHVRILIYRTWVIESPSLAVPLVSILMKFNYIGMFSLCSLSLVKQVTRSPDGKMIKLLTFDILFCHHDIRSKTRGRMTTAATFSRQNNTGSRAYTT